MLKKIHLNLILFIVLAIMVMVSACATSQSPLVQAKSASTVIMDTYHAAYVDVRDTLNNPASTPSQRSIALQKRAILVQIWAVLKPYEDTIYKGGAITDMDMTAVNNLLDQLAAFATGGK